MFLSRNLRWRTLLLLAPVILLYELAGWAHSLFSGHPLSWIEGDFAALAGLRRSVAVRRRNSSGRRLRDKDLLVGGPLTPTPDAVRGGRGVFYGALSRITSAWWTLIRPLAGRIAG